MNIYASEDLVAQKIDENKDWAKKSFIKTPSNAIVGQTIIVKAVDDNGKPIEWEPTNFKVADWNQDDKTSLDYIKNRPIKTIGNLEEISLPELAWRTETHNSITFIGARVSVESNLAISVGDKIIINIDETEHCDTLKQYSDILYIGDLIAYLRQDFSNINFLFIYGDNSLLILYKGETIPTTCQVYKDSRIIKLDINYLPDGGFGYEGDFSANLEEQEITGFTSSDDGTVYTAQVEIVYPMTEGKIYNVTWNGVEYNNLTCYLVDGAIGVIGTNPMDTNAFNDYPFYIADYLGQGLLIGTNEANESNTLSITSGGLHQIDEKFIPDVIVRNGDKEIILSSSTEGSTKQFKLTVNDDGVLTATEITESTE